MIIILKSKMFLVFYFAKLLYTVQNTIKNTEPLSKPCVLLTKSGELLLSIFPHDIVLGLPIYPLLLRSSRLINDIIWL